MSFTKYGKTFNSEKDMHAYGKMRSESRTRALARKSGMSSDEKERASIRKHFASESKHFKMK